MRNLLLGVRGCTALFPITPVQRGPDFTGVVRGVVQDPVALFPLHGHLTNEVTVPCAEFRTNMPLQLAALAPVSTT